MDALCGNGRNIVEALNANVYGNGTQTLVLSHGYGTDQTAWHYLIPFLACYFKSAMIGCIAATKRPQLFEHLILLSGSPRYLNAKGYTGGFETSEIDTILREINRNFTSWVQNFAPVAIGVNDTTAITEFKYSLRRMKPKTALSVAKTVFLSDLRRVLPKVKVPCTIIQSKKDHVVPKVVAYYMKRELGGQARVKILETEGHFPQLTAYSSLLKVMKKVLYIKE